MDGSPELSVQILGPVALHIGAVPVSLGGAKQRTVLAILALNPSRVVPVEQIVSAVWGESVPNRAIATLQVYASNLRRAITAAGGPPILHWQAPGYRLAVVSDQIDLGRFRSLATSARMHRAAGADPEAVAELRQALALWHGATLGGLSSEGGIAHHVRRLDNERQAALELRLDIELSQGRSPELLPELTGLVDQAPLNEGLAARLILALYRAGRQADAFSAYARIRDSLAEELGIDPGPELRELHAAVLSQSPDLLVPSPRPAGPRAADVSTLLWSPTQPTSAWLVLAGGHRTPVGDEDVYLGRADDCAVVLQHASVSRRHCVIAATPEGHTVTDLESTNGTTLNGDPLVAGTPSTLADGDEIWIGAVVATYTMAGPVVRS